MSHQPNVTEVADCLLRIEIELRRLDAWADQRPSEQALQSTQPFAVDTLEFTEWLQFIFLERMKWLVEQGQALPSVSGMAPMAEEYFRAREESGRALIRELAAMDRLLSK
ncbi:YqcC family protein [Marinobacter xestospongiae]|uniref:YqcC family protein n=1 Tax=Marinobacter xestospongiae TaxID=994319 RepID=A0ABU3W1P1_9GAMM|nr:YqcC family protein [Marinobacter xestospongiae]MCG8516992.1 YqcC family protein [Pseudomonadales bacterium]MDV2080459.1 YqcC family protein [Marinobacter xestospongiae]